MQRVLVHRSVYPALEKKLVAAVKELRSGDPRDEATFIGPLIDEAAALRIDGWIDDAVEGGAKALVRGKRQRNLLPAALLAGVPRTADLYRKEAFGPVASLEAFDDFDEAIARANKEQRLRPAGRRVHREHGRAMQAWDGLEVGAVVIGDVPRRPCRQHALRRHQAVQASAARACAGRSRT